MQAAGIQTDRRQTIGPNTRWVEQLDVPADVQFVSSVRRRLVDLLFSAGVAPNDIHDLAVAVSEAVSNAIEHARPGDREPVVCVRCEVDEGTVCVIVRDRGGAPWDPAAVPPEADPVHGVDKISHHGRGIQFMSALTDEMKIGVHPDGTEVRLVKRRQVAH